MRQNFKPTHLIVADELAVDRTEEWIDMAGRLYEEDITLFVFKPDQPIRKAARNLVAAYNQSIDHARDLGYTDGDLFISLQDYIWVPEDGIERFVILNLLAPDALLTGVTHISIDPFETQIGDIEGMYTIFKEPYTDKPRRIFWNDSRVVHIYKPNGGNLINIEPQHWEANWAAIPFKYFNLGMRWSEIYDTGYAYENMDFALKCREDLGAQVIMDAANVAISLPHRDYFQGEAEDLQKYNNRELYESMWS